ncbi:hypothetical protein EYC80_004206 [Monilinia laxa]|uniref:PEBP-like protein n=1 Tax=Monilinia laxa TaxID=61186 RepID=A0A5N6KMF1_MONLA|nr:hypothetical protein EYC80_004206 [Monilinia laxa]
MPANALVKPILDAIGNNPSQVLGVTYNGKVITTKQYRARAQAQFAPEISYAVPDTSLTCIVVILDLDAPFPSFGFHALILHWILSGRKAGRGNALTSDTPFIANYIGPAPPPGSGPYRYSFYLFEQPEDLDGEKYAPAGGKTLSNWFRMRYDLDNWQKTAKLGEPLAANYFLSN